MTALQSVYVQNLETLPIFLFKTTATPHAICQSLQAIIAGAYNGCSTYGSPLGSGLCHAVRALCGV